VEESVSREEALREKAGEEALPERDRVNEPEKKAQAELPAQILERFGLGSVDLRKLSPLTLAWIGDGIYDLVLRTMIAGQGNAPVNRLNRKAIRFACATRQSKMILAIEDALTEEEKQVFRRGRNATSHTKAKNASTADYRKATGFEALMGYLYLAGQMDRLLELVRIGMQRTEAE
jgi:ribonuclease-3 family protein